MCKVDVGKCEKCGDCIRVCPVRVLEADEEGFPYPNKPEECLSCGTCQYICEMDAITIITQEKL